MSSTLPGFDSKSDGPTEEGSAALAGKALASALKSGDGQAVFDAFSALVRELEESQEDEETMDSEIMAG